MSEPTPPDAPTAPGSGETGPEEPGWIRPAHKATLVGIALCALYASLQTATEPEPAPDRDITWAVSILAVATIGGRLLASSPVAGLGLRSVAALASLGSALAMGVLAARLAMTTGAVNTGVAFAAAALILAIRPPVPPRIRRRPPQRDA
jgi:peptidoglycan/LPS O-acetylase OafA/YrhL